MLEVCRDARQVGLDSFLSFPPLESMWDRGVLLGYRSLVDWSVTRNVSSGTAVVHLALWRQLDSPGTAQYPQPSLQEVERGAASLWRLFPQSGGQVAFLIGWRS